MGDIHMMPVEVHFKPSGGHWLGLCPSLGLITQGETFERTQENLREMLWLFFDSCLKRGVLEQVLKQAGFTKNKIGAVMEAARAYNMMPLAAAETECRA